MAPECQLPLSIEGFVAVPQEMAIEVHNVAAEPLSLL